MKSYLHISDLALPNATLTSNLPEKIRQIKKKKVGLLSITNLMVIIKSPVETLWTHYLTTKPFVITYPLG